MEFVERQRSGAARAVLVRVSGCIHNIADSSATSLSDKQHLFFLFHFFFFFFHIVGVKPVRQLNHLEFLMDELPLSILLSIFFLMMCKSYDYYYYMFLKEGELI